MSSIFNNIKFNIWKEKINYILNSDDIIILYKWSYNKCENKWYINLYDKFLNFIKNYDISVCDNFKLYNQIKSKILLCNKPDEFIINNRLLCIASYYGSAAFTPFKFNPETINKKILIRSCGIKHKNFYSFPIGVFDRDNIDMIANTYRFRTFKPIKEILSLNLNKNKKIINYAYFMQSVRLNDESPIINPRYVELCNICNDSLYVSKSTNQQNYWNDASNHLFNISVSWNAIESTKLWESLYMGVIPIVIEFYEENNFIEDFYNDLPILYIKDLNLLKSEDFLIKSYISIMNKIDTYNFEKLKMSYWENFLSLLK